MVIGSTFQPSELPSPPFTSSKRLGNILGVRPGLKRKKGRHSNVQKRPCGTMQASQYFIVVEVHEKERNRKKPKNKMFFTQKHLYFIVLATVQYGIFRIWVNSKYPCTSQPGQMSPYTISARSHVPPVQIWEQDDWTNEQEQTMLDDLRFTEDFQSLKGLCQKNAKILELL